MNNEFVSVPREYLDDVLSIDVPRTQKALENFKALLAQPAAQHPSAPVERDERAEFERSIILERTNDGYSDVALTSILDRGSNGQYQSIRVAGAWEGWQARAALERKA